MHSLLKRQLKRFFGEEKTFSPDCEAFLAAVDQAYSQFDGDRAMLERSLDLSSKELLEASSEMRAVLRAWPDIIFRIEPDGTIINYSTNNTSDIFPASGGLAGKRIQDVPSPDLSRQFTEAMQKVISSREMVTLEYSLPLVSKDKIFEARLLPITDNKLLVIIRNISDRKRLENRVMQSEKMSAVGQLAGGVAHEINNPLGVILGFSQAVLGNIGPDHLLSGPLRHIEKEALRCKTLVSDLLMFSRTSNTDYREKINVNDAITEAFSLVTAQSKLRHVNVVADLSPGLPAISGNKNQIQQVVINLCSNGIDAMPQGGKIKVKTSQSASNGKGAVLLEVSDTGGGIPPEIQKKIFEPFFTTKEVGKGTGLGLSLVYEIVQKHGAAIDLKSGPGEGTTFRIYFPVEPPLPLAA